MDIVGNLLRIFGYGAAELLYSFRCRLGGLVIPLALIVAFLVYHWRECLHRMANIPAVIQYANNIKHVQRMAFIAQVG
jgi:hypothetical protein